MDGNEFYNKSRIVNCCAPMISLPRLATRSFPPRLTKVNEIIITGWMKVVALAHLVAGWRRSSVTWRWGRRRRGGDSFGNMGVRSVQAVREAMIHVLWFGRRVEVLHWAKILGGHRLKGRRPQTCLKERKQDSSERWQGYETWITMSLLNQ